MTHQFARRSGWAMLAAVLTAALLTVYAHSVPGGEFGLTMLAYALWMALGLAWVVLVGFLLATRRLRRHRLFWVAPPLVVLLVGGLVVTGVPLLARFELSRAALERFADGGRIPGEGEWIGLYPVERAQRHPGGVRLLVTGTGFLDSWGFAWNPGGEPPDLGGEDSYFHLTGSWYLWRESW